MFLGANMVGVESQTLEHVCDNTKITRHAILIDPADQTPETAAKRAMAAVAAGSKMILVGGSSDTDMDNVNNTVVAIQEALELVTWASSQDSDFSEEKNWKVIGGMFLILIAVIAGITIPIVVINNNKTP